MKLRHPLFKFQTLRLAGVWFSLAVSLLLFPQWAQAKDKSQGTGYIVAPFGNSDKVRNWDWMEVALPFVLGEKLEAHPTLRGLLGPLVLPEGRRGPLQDPLVAARKTGARYVFTGRFRRPDWKLELTVEVHEVVGNGKEAKLNKVGEHTELVEYADVFKAMDKCLQTVLQLIDRLPPKGRWGAITRQPTSDFYAFTLFGRGLRDLLEARNKKEYARAEKNLRRSIFIDPKFAEGHRALAVLYDRTKKPGKAEGRRNYALEIRPDYYTPLRGLTRAAYGKKNRVEGIPLARRALALRPWDIEVRYMLGDMLWEEGSSEDAYEQLSIIVKEVPDHLKARRVLVLVHASMGHGEELAAELEAVLKLDPKDEAARLDLGAAYYALDRVDDAIAEYEKVIKRNPKQVQALKFLGDIYKERDELPKAITYYERAMVADRNDPRPYFLLGAAYNRAGDHRKAIRVYSKATRFKKYAGDAYNNLGTIHMEKGNQGQAIWYLKKAADKKPNSARIH